MEIVFSGLGKLSEIENCPECKQRGFPVKEITLKNFVQQPLRTYAGFFFCHNPDCEVVYFNNTAKITIKKDQLNVRVGIKEKEPPRPICYCFGYNIEDLNENTVEEIKQKIKEIGCQCEIKNPSGRCCLSDIKDFLNQI
ncbi:hypothetical protein [Persephonella sp.]|uniref:putative iron-sulfur cluster-binding metallochaperone n=1 Tax=Persephonella sp. TaxID=2060922 RepID=UPI0026199CD4|nr:hypothetical protein [Persephonella sp.]